MASGKRHTRFIAGANCPATLIGRTADIGRSFNDGCAAQHQDRVLGFADRLRADGIDAEVDQYNTSPSEGWPLWCERQIEAQTSC